MNRGRGRQIIFHEKPYYEAFLSTIEEAQLRFKCVIHAYCLMGNHYHLLIETPNANLSRIMRHINGVYTQRYNRLRKTDGPLFRGRYKAILVDCDAYLLKLSRYIHRNPVDMRRSIVSSLADYPWSSYPAYVGRAKSPKWLDRDMVYEMLGQKQCFKGYAKYVLQGVDKETEQFYQKGNLAAIIGEKHFKAWVFDKLLPELESEKKARIVQPDLTMGIVIDAVINAYGVTENDIRRIVKGPQNENEARKLAMYLCQELSGATLGEIAKYFNLSHPGSVSYTTHQIREKRRAILAFSRDLDRFIKSIINQAT